MRTATINDVGQETLRGIADVDHYNSWIYRLMQPYIGTRVARWGAAWTT